MTKVERNILISFHIFLQKHYRAYLVRKANILFTKRAEKHASIQIQSLSRGYHIRKQKILEEKRLWRDSATTIQKHYRSWAVRTGDDLKHKIVKRDYKRKTCAATRIQAQYRRHMSKRIINKK